MAGVRWAAAATMIALAACQAPDADAVPAPSAAAAPPSLASTGGLAFPRTLQADRMVEVQVETPGAERGIVVSVALDSPYFGPSGTVPTNVLLEPGWTARLRVPLGPALCPAATGASVATVEVRAFEGEEVAAHEVTIADAVLAEINADECRQRLATDAAAPSFAPEPIVRGDLVETAVEFTRGTSTAPATVTSMSGTVIFSLEPATGALPLTLGPEDSDAEVPVAVRATRCDAHAAVESKKTFVFTAAIEVAGEPITVEYRAEGEARRALQRALDACLANLESDGIGGQG